MRISDWSSDVCSSDLFAWRVGIKGLLQIEEGFHLKKSPEGTRLTHRLCCSGIGSWPGIVTSTFLRRQLVRTGAALERNLRRGTVISRYAQRNARPRLAFRRLSMRRIRSPKAYPAILGSASVGVLRCENGGASCGEGVCQSE